MRYLIGALLTICFCYLPAQEKERDFYDSLRYYNLSKVFNPDSITDGDVYYKRPEPIGYIDTSYHRFRIHLSYISQDKTNPYKYKLAGKTKMYNYTCTFTGTLTVTAATIIDSSALMLDIGASDYKPGYISSEIVIYQDSACQFAGKITGSLNTSIVMDKTAKLQYDALWSVSDSYSNNMVEATWTSYKTGVTKKCNWGDYRIPDSGDLDVGTGEFFPNDKYLQYGWKSYIKMAAAETEEEYDRLLDKDQYWWK